MTEAKKEAADIHEKAVRVANQKADDIIGEAKIKAKGLVERTEKELDEERKKLQQDIEKEITDVSFVVAEKVLARDITKEDNKRKSASKSGAKNNMSKSEQVAKVTVTIKPDDETMKKIADFVKRHNCYSVDYIIDENIIGGIIIQIGDVIYDGSVRGRLENIKQAL